MQRKSPRTLHIVVGVAAMIAPVLHTFSDVLEWHHGRYSDAQLWLNYAAFLPMPWLLLGVYAVHEPKPGAAALVGALLYGASFTYFAHTTLYAMAAGIPDYATLWQQLGWAYTMHGAAMVCGGLLFAASVLRAGWLRRQPVMLFLTGIIVNLIMALVPVPDALQIVGSAIRNLGLVAIGYDILIKRPA